MSPAAGLHVGLIDHPVLEIIPEIAQVEIDISPPTCTTVNHLN